jgi:hypothetical protein
VFSNGGLTGTRLHGRLNPRTFEALQILKSGYCNGHIGAAEQAEAHYDAMMDVINILEDNENEG